MLFFCFLQDIVYILVYKTNSINYEQHKQFVSNAVHITLEKYLSFDLTLTGEIFSKLHIKGVLDIKNIVEGLVFLFKIFHLC